MLCKGGRLFPQGLIGAGELNLKQNRFYLMNHGFACRETLTTETFPTSRFCLSLCFSTKGHFSHDQHIFAHCKITFRYRNLEGHNRAHTPKPFSTGIIMTIKITIKNIILFCFIYPAEVP